MPGSDEFIEAVANASSWDQRVAQVRRIADQVARADQPAVYAAVARAFYAPNLTYEFSEVAWPPSMTEDAFEEAYSEAVWHTDTFTSVSTDDLAAMLTAAPRTLRVLRLIVGFTRQEFAAATVDAGIGVSGSSIKTMERGGRPRKDTDVAARCAATVTQIVEGSLYPPHPPGTLRTKLQKPDTRDGWEGVRRFAVEGVPYSVLLHQRLYGGGFRQLSDAGAAGVGKVLEEGVGALLDSGGIEYVRTGSSRKDKQQVAERFGLTLNLVPDFVIHKRGALRAFLECKSINDGGTARDKASRFENYRREAERRGGIPVLAVLNGKGWERAGDALGPVVRDCDGRVFTPATLNELLTVDPFPQLMAEP
ncbi:MAG: hypothetical protein ACRDZN_10625 [Acidimicrobiales bacterium]